MACNPDILVDRPLGGDIVDLCTSSDSVSSLLANSASLSPSEAWQKLYGGYRPTKPATTGTKGDEEDLARAARCGKWGPTQPSELFLRIYRDVLAVVEESPDRAMVSPSLLGSCGVVPLTVISTIPDIVRHMANLIARAEKEVFLATNYWQDSVASRYLTNGIRELNRRAEQRGARIVMKILYDRGSPKQLLDPHYLVGEEEYTGKNVALPAAKDIPNIALEVMNYHQPIMGTFHSKYMVVDRRIALVQSNNIQDNDNMEMMVQLEGPIVDSFYDMALMSWSRKPEPPLPSRNSPAAEADIAGQGESQSATAEGEQKMEKVSTQTPDTLKKADAPTDGQTTEVGPKPALAPAATQPPPAVQQKRSELRPNIPNGPDTATQSFLASAKQQLPKWYLGQPSSNAELPQSTSEHPQYDPDIAHETQRVEASMLPRPDETFMDAVSRLLNHTTNHLAGDAPDYAEGDRMTPYIPHDVARLAPIAMVNRPPHGTPTHSAYVQPQNAAWLSALRNAKKNVFIQSPTLNSELLVPAIREACERGLDVICYICMGYNDAGELLPKQGGTNEMIAYQLYTSLSTEGRKHLHYFWYVAKDQTRPIPQIKKKRDCHIKLMIVDECIGIQGNGNQDTQSWFHSQEINVMIDSAEVCQAWIEGLRRNQNTHIYGMLDKESGIWRDSEGKEAEGAMGVDPGHFSWLKGIMGAIRRVQGKGGF